ncbi:MAG TPA: 2OG-Fe(II) oxygenase [Candidatus Saccharimonadia bacterium]|nr:2OG-Fe(II) oxygenase [Candidatus Saccharimonadia bacterium]
MDDFIEIYPGAIDAASCAALIRRFEQAGTAQRGATGGGVDLKLKDSWDIRITGAAAWQDADQALNVAVFAGLAAYVRKYRFALIAPFSLKLPDAAGGLRAIDDASFETLDDESLRKLLIAVFRPGSINLQKYLADVGGYPYWHCEHYPKDATAETLHRTLLWTIYLNEGFADGETEFVYQKRRIVPRTGSLLIAPASFTHTHRGNRPSGGDKYIATSWVLFQRAEVLYRAPPAPSAPAPAAPRR